MRARPRGVSCAAKGERALLTLAFTAKVAASPRCVWRVLSDPTAAAAWLPSFGGWIYEPRASLSARGELRFRSRLCGVPVQADVRVLEVKPGCVRGLVRFGLLACEVKFSLSPEPGVAGVTRIGLVLSVANRIALVGGTLDRFEVRRLASGLAEQVLGGLSAQAEEFARA